MMQVTKIILYGFLILSFSLAITFCLFIICGQYKSAQCIGMWSDYGDVKYDPFAGCMIHYKGRWTPSGMLLKSSDYL